MYNRYIPQADGTFQRSRVPEAKPETPDSPVTEPIEKAESVPWQPPSPPPSVPHMQRSAQRNSTRTNRSRGSREQSLGSVSSFLRQLLPQNFEAEDVLVVLLLLLMSGKNAENQDSALLTLAIYLFM